MENPPYYAPFNFIKQLTSSIREAINPVLNNKQQCVCVYARAWSANW